MWPSNIILKTWKWALSMNLFQCCLTASSVTATLARTIAEWHRAGRGINWKSECCFLFVIKLRVTVKALSFGVFAVILALWCIFFLYTIIKLCFIYAMSKVWLTDWSNCVILLNAPYNPVRLIHGKHPLNDVAPSSGGKTIFHWQFLC